MEWNWSQHNNSTKNLFAFRVRCIFTVATQFSKCPNVKWARKFGATIELDRWKKRRLSFNNSSHPKGIFWNSPIGWICSPLFGIRERSCEIHNVKLLLTCFNVCWPLPVPVLSQMIMWYGQNNQERAKNSRSPMCGEARVMVHLVHSETNTREHEQNKVTVNGIWIWRYVRPRIGLWRTFQQPSSLIKVIKLVSSQTNRDSIDKIGSAWKAMEIGK